MGDRVFEEFLRKLIDYLRKNDLELFNYLDNCFRIDSCDREVIEGAFDMAYMHWLFIRDIKASAKIIRDMVVEK